MSDNKNIITLIVGILGLITILIVGKWLLDQHHYKNQQMIECTPDGCKPYPHYCPTKPEYHNSYKFWEGYEDGWDGMSARNLGYDYVKGYEIGVYDRRAKHRYYYERYYPSTFKLNAPGLKIDVR